MFSVIAKKFRLAENLSEVAQSLVTKFCSQSFACRATKLHKKWKEVMHMVGKQVLKARLLFSLRWVSLILKLVRRLFKPFQ